MITAPAMQSGLSPYEGIMMTDPVLIQALAKLDVVERVTPRLIATLERILAECHAKCADMGTTPEDWTAMSFAEREDLLAEWRKRNRRRSPKQS